MSAKWKLDLDDLRDTAVRTAKTFAVALIATLGAPATWFKPDMDWGLAIKIALGTFILNIVLAWARPSRDI